MTKSNEVKIHAAAEYLRTEWINGQCIYSDGATNQEYVCDSESDMLHLYSCIHSDDEYTRDNAYSVWCSNTYHPERMDIDTVQDKIDKGAALRDVELVEYFALGRIADDEIIDTVRQVASQYKYGDDVFWVLRGHYIERCAGGWYAKAIEGDTDDAIAAAAIARYYSDDSTPEDAIAMFGLDYLSLNYLDLASTDNGGQCVIWVYRNYSSGTITSSPKSKYLADDDANTVIFANYQAAQQYINDANAETYYLNHGEISRPDYYICIS